MKVLITGGTGIIGRYLLRRIKDEVKVFATYFRNREFQQFQNVGYYRLDVASAQDIVNLFRRIRPDVVVHTASIGSVDLAEDHKDKAWQVNVAGTKNVLGGAKICGSKFIFVSSNAVFDGRDAPYKETDTPNPINYYGKLKLEGEQIVSSSGLDYVILRPILTYGWNDPGERPNPVTWLLSELKHNEPVKVVDDIYCNPLLASNCAAAIWSIIANGRSGIYHVGGKDRISRFDFAVKTAKAFGLNYNLVEPVPNSYFENIAPRPKDTTYSTRKMEEELGVRPIGVDEGLEIMLSEREVVLWQR